MVNSPKTSKNGWSQTGFIHLPQNGIPFSQPPPKKPQKPKHGAPQTPKWDPIQTGFDPKSSAHFEDAQRAETWLCRMASAGVKARTVGASVKRSSSSAVAVQRCRDCFFPQLKALGSQPMLLRISPELLFFGWGRGMAPPQKGPSAFFFFFSSPGFFPLWFPFTPPPKKAHKRNNNKTGTPKKEDRLNVREGNIEARFVHKQSPLVMDFHGFVRKCDVRPTL